MLLDPFADGDLYHTIAQAVQSHVYVQTWGCQKDRADSDCSGPNHVYNIKTIKKVLGPASTWSPTKDHSKWCVTNSESNSEWTCIADVNRAQTQYQRRGGALCIENKDVRDKFWEFAREFDECSTTPTNMDIDCEPDSDPVQGKRIHLDPSVTG